MSNSFSANYNSILFASPPKNEVVIPFIYDEASSFGYDRNGSPAFPGMAYVNIGMSEEGRMRLISDGKWGLIDKKGEIVLPVKYGYISPVNENMASIVDGERIDTPRPDGAYSWEVIGKMGFVNRKGEIAIPVEYDYDYEACFKDGYVTLKKDGVMFQFNMRGELVEK